jgi:hypothetical protein
MEDSREACGTIFEQNGSFVVRQFSGARIERLLLTRLFDLTTGSRTPEAPAGTPSVPFPNSQWVSATDQQQEAA